MRRTINRKQFENELAICKKVIGKGSKLAICQAVKLSFYDGGMAMSCTNLERAYQVEFGDQLFNHWVQTDAEKILINIDNLLKIIKAAPKRLTEISLEITWDGEGLLINGVTTIIKAGNTDDYPALPQFPQNRTYNLFLYDTLECVNAISGDKNDRRSHVQSIYINAQEGRAVSTDGSRLYAAAIKAESSLKPFMLDKSAAGILCNSYLRDRVGQFRLSHEKTSYGSVGNLFFHLGNACMTVRISDGEFPEYGTLLEMLNDDPALILSIPDKQIVADTIKEAMAILNDSYRGIILNVNGEITITSTNPDLGEFQRDISADLTRCGIDLEMALNPAFLLDAMEQISEPGINFYFKGPENPAMIESVDGTFQAIIMPMRA